MKNIVTLPDRKSVQQEAATWIMRLDEGPLLAAEETELQRWVSQSHLHYQMLMEQAEAWAQADVLEHLREHMPHKAEFLKKKTVADRSRTTVLKPVWLTVFVFFGFFLGVSLVDYRSAPDVREVSTRVGEVKEVVLADQSIITLNTNSRVLVQYAKNQRKVTLLNGEASFNVAKNPEVPFVVYAGKGISWAVGTEFVVRKNPKSVEIVVTEGEVKVFSNLNSVKKEHLSLSLPLANVQSEALITGGQKIRYNEKLDAVESLDPESIEQEVAWKHSALIFRGETLEEAIEEIQRYVAKEIIISDPELLKKRVGGRFKFENIDNLLLAIESGWGLQMRETNDVIILASNQLSGEEI